MILCRSIYSPVSLPWKQNAVFVEELFLGAFGAFFFSTTRMFISHIPVTLVKLCVRRGGGVGARQSITPETRSTLWGLKKRQYACIPACVCVCWCTCVVMGVRQQTSKEGASVL